MRLVFLLTGIFLAVAPIRGSEWLKMSVSPTQSLAPAYLRVRVTVEPNEVNRTVVIAAESDDYYRSSEMPLGVALCPFSAHPCQKTDAENPQVNR